ncbi:hypothetical protein RB596_005500 [Gaeumannomyces avenae]
MRASANRLDVTLRPGTVRVRRLGNYDLPTHRNALGRYGRRGGGAVVAEETTPPRVGTSRSTELKAHHRRSGSSPAAAQDAARLPCSATYPADCPATRKACVCAPYQGATLDCVFQGCKGWDVILAKRATSVACGDPFPEDGRTLQRLSWACIGIATFAVLLRLAARLATAGRSAERPRTSRGVVNLWWDDALLLATYAVMVVVMVMSEVALRHGFGDGPWVGEPNDLHIQGLLVFIGEPVYFVGAALLKASFLFFFARIFAVGSSMHQRWGLPLGSLRDRWTLTNVLRAAHLANLVVAVTFAFVAFFQCKPLEYFWKGWDGITQGTCINRKAVPLVHASLGILLDLWILMIPLCMLPSLRVSFWTKMGIACMFCVGTLATVVSCLRIPSLAKDIESSYSLTWNQTDVLMWTMIEMTTGVVCACMPGQGALFSRVIRHTRALVGIATSTVGTRTAGSRSRSKGHSRSRPSGGLGGGARGTGAGSAYMSRGTQSSTAGGGGGRGEIVAKTDVTVQEGGVGDGHGEPWGSAVELRSLEAKPGEDGEGAVKTKIWAGPRKRTSSLPDQPRRAAPQVDRSRGGAPLMPEKP